MTAASPPTAAPKQPSAEKPLPRLRSDIRIEDGGVDADGHPVSIIVDPLRNAYFRLGWPESDVIACLKPGMTAQHLAARVSVVHGFEIDREDVGAIVKFLCANQLTQFDEHGSWGRYAMMAKAGQHGLLMTLVHNYLFFRIPLFRPDAFLARALKLLGFIYTKVFLVLCLIVSATGFYFISREWSEFEAMFWRMARLQNIALYAGVLLCLKAVHELGHALTSARMGCRVPTMGIAFMFGTPVFYTDTTDCWRLHRRSERLAVVVAGVGAECIVAAFAALLWPFLAEGLAREICFAVMTSTLATTFLVNLNPFMRFDGYFALSDLLDMPNLQPRAFGLALWRLREALFGIGKPAPEALPRRLGMIVTGYAMLTAIYRLFLFCGIAAVVYAMSFKLMGLALGLFEIVMFVAMPIVKELAVWWGLRGEMKDRRRAFGFVAAATLIIAVLLTPWMQSVSAPVVLAAAIEGELHLPLSARLISIAARDGQTVRKGDVLFHAEQPNLAAQLTKARTELQSARVQLGRLTGSDKERQSRFVIEAQARRLSEQITALIKLQGDLDVRAPFDGTVVDLDAALQPGLWINSKAVLARVVGGDGLKLRGLVDEAALARLHVGAQGRFVADDGIGSARAVSLVAISDANETTFNEAALADVYGGAVAAQEEGGRIRPRATHFEISLVATGERPASVVRGVVSLEAEATSPLLEIWRQVARVLVREQSF